MRIAVIGTGIAGLGAAHALRRVHDVVVFERDDRPGGHSDTHVVTGADGVTRAIDTGFIVHNPANYPLLTRLFGELGVATRPSEMSFSVTCERCGLSYAGRDPMGQLRNLRSPRVVRLLAEVARFLMTAGRWLDGRHRTRTLDQLVRAEGFSADFRDHFLLPFTGAIWSMPAGGARAFPADTALRFFANHSMLGWRRHTWRTVEGGSREYVRRIVAGLGDRVQLSTAVEHVRREPGRVVVATSGGAEHSVDAVVIAAHSDQALRMLDDPTPDERAVLGAIDYRPNVAVLHTDRGLLPPEGAPWASWNHLISDCRDESEAPGVTYLMNRLMRFDAPDPWCVTLNRENRIAPSHVYARMEYAHPQYDFAAVRAQARLPEVSGADRVWFAGAYHRHGFHEDGLRAGLAAAAGLGAPW